MSDLNRRTRADWAQFEAAGRDLEARADALDLEREDLAAEIEPLRLASEGGSIEYKRNLLSTSFRAIEDARYRSLTAKQIAGVATEFAKFVYIATAQRMMADGTLAIRDHPRAEGERYEPEPVTDVKQIIAEIQERVKDDPEARMKQPVKNILMQLSRYSRELEQFKEVTARTQADKRAPIAANFRRTTEEIFASIRRNYEQLLEDERSAVASQPKHILLRLPIKKLSGLFLRQAKAAMEIRSGLLWARDEQSGTRERLLELADRHDQLMATMKDEEKQYNELGGTPRIALEIARAFARELEKRLERETEVY
ncbi:MAG: hypothetical protein ACOC1U_01100 [Spirochaetota bacterium]